MTGTYIAATIVLVFSVSAFMLGVGVRRLYPDLAVSLAVTSVTSAVVAMLMFVIAGVSSVL